MRLVDKIELDRVKAAHFRLLATRTCRWLPRRGALADRGIVILHGEKTEQGRTLGTQICKGNHDDLALEIRGLPLTNCATVL